MFGSGITPELWSYDTFGGCNGGKSSMTYPSDSMSIMNDIELMRYVNQVNNFQPMMAQLMGSGLSQTQSWWADWCTKFQDMMNNISSGKTDLYGNPIRSSEDTSTDDTKVSNQNKNVTEADAIKSFEKMVESMTALNNSKCYGPDKNMTLGDYLLSLIKEYKDPDVCNKTLCDENYEKILEIASKYIDDKTGRLASKDLEILKKIAEDPSTPYSEKADDDSKKNKEDKSYRGSLKDPTTFDSKAYSLAQTMHDGMKGWNILGSWGDDAKVVDAIMDVDSENVVEVMENYKESFTSDMHGDYNLIESIYCDFSGEQRQNLINHLKDALVVRAEKLLNTKDKDGNVVVDPRITQFIEDVKSNMGDMNKLKHTFENFKDVIRAAEGTKDKRITKVTNPEVTAA